MYKLGNNLLTLNGAVIYIPPAPVELGQIYEGFYLKTQQPSEEINNDYEDFYVTVDNINNKV